LTGPPNADPLPAKLIGFLSLSDSDGLDTLPAPPPAMKCPLDRKPTTPVAAPLNLLT